MAAGGLALWMQLESAAPGTAAKPVAGRDAALMAGAAPKAEVSPGRASDSRVAGYTWDQKPVPGSEPRQQLPSA